MVIIRLKGGMGNQMFQYAFGKKMASLLETELVLDLSSLLDRSKGDFVYRNYDLPIFNVRDQLLLKETLLTTLYKPKVRRITKWVQRYISKGKGYIKEQHFHFEPTYLTHPKKETIYEGWFQSPKYFEGIEQEIRGEFTFKKKVLNASQPLLKEIQNTNAICLNVRRTDFLKVDTLNTTNKDYFLKAAQYLASKVKQPIFYIFSDDIEWCRKHIQLDYPIKVIGHEHKGFKFGNYMQLMIACKHYIIPNSSFAWWAVWLNKNDSKIVIAPKNWFKDASIDTTDLVHPDWIRL